MIQALDRIVYRLNDKVGEKFGNEGWFQHQRIYGLADLVQRFGGSTIPTYYNIGNDAQIPIDLTDGAFWITIYHRCLKTQLDTGKGGGQSWHSTAVSDILSVVHFNKSRVPYTAADMAIMLNHVWDISFDSNDLYISGMSKVDCKVKDINMDMLDVHKTEYNQITCPLGADSALFAIKTQILAKVDPFNNGSWWVQPSMDSDITT